MVNYKYQFTSTSDDLLDAESASRSLQSPRPPFRYGLILLGVGWLAYGVVGLRARIGAAPLLPLCLGAIVLYQHVIAVQLKRRKLARDYPLPQEITFELGEESIQIEVRGAGRYVRRWAELSRFVERRNGILFFFTDRTVNWLPMRVFAQATDRTALIAFLHQQKSI